MKVEVIENLSNKRMIEPYEMNFINDIKHELKDSIYIRFEEYLSKFDNTKRYCLFGIEFEEKHREIYGEHLSYECEIKAKIGYIND